MRSLDKVVRKGPVKRTGDKHQFQAELADAPVTLLPGETPGEAVRRIGPREVLKWTMDNIESQKLHKAFQDTGFPIDGEVVAEFDVQAMVDSLGMALDSGTYEQFGQHMNAMLDDLNKIAPDAALAAPYPITVFSFDMMSCDGFSFFVIASPIADSSGELGVFLAPWQQVHTNPVKAGKCFFPLEPFIVPGEGEGKLHRSVQLDVVYRIDNPAARDLALLVCEFIIYILALLDCRNVDSAEDAQPERTRQQWRSLKQHGSRSILQRKIIVRLPGKRIEPMSGRGLHRDVARHMVRGHFRRYTEDKPLFGKYVGIVWVPFHTRGSKGDAPELPEYVAVPAGAVEGSE